MMVSLKAGERSAARQRLQSKKLAIANTLGRLPLMAPGAAIARLVSGPGGNDGNKWRPMRLVYRGAEFVGKMNAREGWEFVHAQT